MATEKIIPFEKIIAKKRGKNENLYQIFNRSDSISTPAILFQN